MKNSKHLAIYSGGKNFISNLKKLASKDEKIIELITNNFMKPINNGYCPFTELNGKYKPSTDLNYPNNVMKGAFFSKIKNMSLYHYHFGYKFYTDGHDSNYQGMVSDGILHVKLNHNKNQNVVIHEVFWVHLAHNPFTMPFLEIPN